jgi:hypothetical protein
MAMTRAKASQVTAKLDATGSTVRGLDDKLAEFVSVKDFGAVGDGVADDTAAIQAALDSLVSGGSVFLPIGTYRITASIDITAGKTLRGNGKAFARFTMALGKNPPLSSVIYCDGCSGLTFSEGFAFVENIQIRGTRGGYVGMKVEQPDVSTSNVAINEFWDGVGLWMKNSFRAGHENLNVYLCGAGLVFEDFCSDTTFTNPTIEQCAVGLLTLSGTYYDIKFNGGTLEGLEKGIGTSISAPGVVCPSTGVLTVPASTLSAFGVVQANLEGGAFATGMQANFDSVYFEANSLCHVFAGLDCQLEFNNNYWNDVVALSGANQIVPTHFIKGGDERSVQVNNNRFSTRDSRTAAIFSLNYARPLTFEGNHYLKESGVYTGPVFDYSGGQTTRTDAKFGVQTFFNGGAIFDDGDTLNVYKVGTFSPTYKTSGTNFASVTYDALTGGQFVKIGKLVHFQLFLQSDAIDATGATGTVRIGGLPFTSASHIGSTGSGGSSVSVSDVTGFITNMPLTASVFRASTDIVLNYRATSNGTDVALPIASMGTGANANTIRVSGTYIAA